MRCSAVLVALLASSAAAAVAGNPGAANHNVGKHIRSNVDVASNNVLIAADDPAANLTDKLPGGDVTKKLLDPAAIIGKITQVIGDLISSFLELANSAKGGKTASVSELSKKLQAATALVKESTEALKTAGSDVASASQVASILAPLLEVLGKILSALPIPEAAKKELEAKLKDLKDVIPKLPKLPGTQ